MNAEQRRALTDEMLRKLHPDSSELYRLLVFTATEQQRSVMRVLTDLRNEVLRHSAAMTTEQGASGGG